MRTTVGTLENEVRAVASSGVRRATLVQGVVYMLVGLVWGIVIAKAPFPRLALGAHLQLTTHAVMSTSERPAWSPSSSSPRRGSSGP
jgi:hypothetical protein